MNRLLCYIRIHIQYSVCYMCSNLTWDHMFGEWVHKRQCTTLMTMEQHSACIMKHMCSVCNAVLWHMQCMSMHVYNCQLIS